MSMFDPPVQVVKVTITNVFPPAVPLTSELRIKIGGLFTALVILLVLHSNII